MEDQGFADGSLLNAMGAAGADECYLIGSRTTGEASIHSDADFLLVLNRHEDAFGCFQVAQRFREAIRSSMPCPAGVRCRCSSELPAFARYLMLHGYNTRFARRIGGSGSTLGGLSEVAASAAGRNEYLCVLGEALWTEVRLQGGHADGDTYRAAKVCLTYLNTALISRGKFLPTNSARVAAWQAEHGQSAGICDALACKLGASHEVSEAMLACITQLRNEVIDRVADCEADAAHVDPAVFWLPPSHDREFGAERVEEMFGICECLHQLASGRRPSPRHPRASAQLHDACTEPDGSWSAAAINRFRLSNSHESRRDWGTALDWPHYEYERRTL